MSLNTNTSVLYREIPKGLPTPDQTFEIKKTPIVLNEVQLKANQLLLRTLYLSVDPYMRARMRDLSVKSYFPAAIPGTPFSGGLIGQVLRSTDDKFKTGDVVLAFANWEEYTVVSTTTQGIGGVTLIPNAKNSSVPLSYYLGVLGMPGMTAYAGLHKICEPLDPGQTLYVSAASGAVGQVVGQYGKSLGLRVVGSAGDDAKVAYLKEIGFDDAFNYKTETDFLSALKRTCPKGIDIYFENVGGKMLDAVLQVANDFARIAVCGMISQYNRTEDPEPIFKLDTLIWKRIRLEGFIVSDEMKKYAPQGLKTLTKLVQEGKLEYRETVTQGISNAPTAFVDMLRGKNFGKGIVKVADIE